MKSPAGCKCVCSQVSAVDENEDKGPICPPLPAQYQPGAYNMTNSSITTPQLHKTSAEYAGQY